MQKLNLMAAIALAGYSAWLSSPVAQARASLARRLRVPARHRSDHPAGHPLCRRQQFRRPAAFGLRGGRMRGEAARSALALKSHPAGTCEAKTVVEDAGLLPAGAAPRTTWWCGRRTAGRPRPSGGTIRRLRKQDLFRLGYIAEHSRHSTGAALDLTLVDLTADNSAAFDPAKTYADCTAPASRPRAGRQRRHGHRLRLLRRQGEHRARSITPEQRQLAQHAGGRDGEAGFCELFEGVVALFDAGRGRAGV